MNPLRGPRSTRPRLAQVFTIALLAMAVVMIVLALVHAVARADTGAAAEPPSSVLEWVAGTALRIVAGLALVAALAGAHRLLRVLEERTKHVITAEQETFVDRWISQAIDFVEEQARKHAVNRLGKITGPEKLEMAVRYVMELIERQGWTGWLAGVLAKRIESALQRKRAFDAPLLDAPQPQPDAAALTL